MQLLFVNACISERGQESRTLKLSRAFLDAYLETHPADTVVTADLSRLPIQPFDREALEARNAKASQGDFSGPEFQLARDFQSANKIVVAAPFCASISSTFPPAVCAIIMTSRAVTGIAGRSVLPT